MAEDVKVPEGWRKIPLLEKLAFIKGKAPRKFYNFKEKNTIRYLTPECLRGRNNETLYCNIYEAEIVNDDVVVLWDGSNAGEIFFAKDGAIASTMAKIEIDEKSHKRFFYYYLKLYEPILKYQIKGSGIPHVEKDIFGLLPNTFPSLPEQRKIAEILETVDNAIEKTGRIIEKYKRIKQGLMQDLLTRGIAESEELGVRSYELRDEKKHRFKDSPLGRIPEEWKVGYVSKFAEINPKTGINPTDIYPFIEMDATPIMGKWYKYLSFRKGSEAGSKFKGGDILLARITPCAENGKALLVPNDIRVGIGSTEFIVFRAKDGADNVFLFYLLVSDFVRNIAIGLMEGTSGRQRIPTYVFEEVIKVAIPESLEEQHRIASILSQIDEAIEKEQKYKEKLERIKKGLMEDLLTGKVRVLGVMNYELGVRS